MESQNKIDLCYMLWENIPRSSLPKNDYWFDKVKKDEVLQVLTSTWNCLNITLHSTVSICNKIF